MTARTESLTERPAWKALKAHYNEVRDLHLRKLFTDDPSRGEQMTAEAAGIYLDYSKNRVTAKTLRLLLDLAEASGLRARIDGMFRGEKINVSERRAVLHVALRAPKGASIMVDGENVVPAVHDVLDRMARRELKRSGTERNASRSGTYRARGRSNAPRGSTDDHG